MIGGAARLAAALFLAGAAAAEGEGFGEQVADGPAREVFAVTTLAASGPGSLAAALDGGGRRVVFDVAGEILPGRAYLDVRGPFITIDGTSAPAPGITIRGGGLRITGTDVHDVAVRGLRIRDPIEDGIQISHGAHRVLVDHVSVDRCGDGNVDITHGAHDVTLSWSLLSRCGKNVLIKYGARRVSVHHNAFVSSRWRNPWVANQNDGSSAADTVADVRHNLIWGWGDDGGGSGFDCGASGNLVNNVYSSPGASARAQSKAVVVKDECPGGEPALVFADANVGPDGQAIALDGVARGRVPLPAPAVPGRLGCAGVRDILESAGARPLDSIDAASIAAIGTPFC